MKNNLSDQSLESLTKQRNLLKGAAIGFGFIIIILFSLVIYLSVTKDKVSLLAVLPGSLIIMFPILMRISQLNAAIKSKSL